MFRLVAEDSSPSNTRSCMFNASARMLSVVLIAVFCLPMHLQAQDTAEEIQQIIQNSRADNAFWSVVARDTTGEVLTAYNAEKQVRPASNLKLITSAAILDELGPDYRYTTKVYGWGEQQGDTWQGDIIIRGVGDPSISGQFYHEDRFHVFEKFFTALDTLGIRRINGDLIGNDAFFDGQSYPKGWNWDDLSFYYGVETSALSFNNNAVDLRVLSGGRVGETPGIQWFPFDTDYVNFINEQVITPPGSEYDEFYRRILGTNTIILRSKVPQNYLETESLSIMNASLFFMDTFKKYLEDGDIELEGRIIVDDQQYDWESENYKVLSSHRSVPLRELLTQINRESSNFYTEMMLKTAAASRYETQGTTELGLTLVEEFAASLGIDTTKVELTDGSGMSPATLMSAEDITHLLVELQKRPDFQVFKQSLSLSGINGSLQHRFKGTPLYREIFGKTGYVSGVRSMSGYITSASGRPLVFSIITNNYTEKTSYIDYLQETILRQIYDKY